jgi:hypothetical protein
VAQLLPSDPDLQVPLASSIPRPPSPWATAVPRARCPRRARGPTPPFGKVIPHNEHLRLAHLPSPPCGIISRPRSRSIFIIISDMLILVRGATRGPYAFATFLPPYIGKQCEQPIECELSFPLTLCSITARTDLGSLYLSAAQLARASA